MRSGVYRTVVLKEQDLDKDARMNKPIFGHLLVWMQKPTKEAFHVVNAVVNKKT